VATTTVTATVTARTDRCPSRAARPWPCATPENPPVKPPVEVVAFHSSSATPGG
jgi:hypothetical protein